MSVITRHILEDIENLPLEMQVVSVQKNDRFIKPMNLKKWCDYYKPSN